MRIARALAQQEQQRRRRDHDHQLPDLEADVELQQRPDELRGRQIQFGQHAGEAEAVDQAEEEGDDDATATKDRPQIVERGEHDRDGDRRLDERWRQRHPFHRGERERDRVRERERGDDAEHRQHRVRQPFDRAPSVLRAAHHRRQQQAQQEQHVVVAAQDVMDALAQELGRRGRRRLCCDFTPRCRGGCCNDLRCRRCDRRRNDALGSLRIEHPQHRRLARELDARDAAMGRIDFAQNRVANRRRRRRHTVSPQRQCGIDAVDAPLQRLRRRLQFAAGDLHTRGHIGFDARPRSANLAPGQLAVGVRIEIECDVEIAQRDVDTHGGAGFVARELKVGIARLVRPHQR